MHRIHTSAFKGCFKAITNALALKSNAWEGEEMDVLAYELEQNHPFLAHKLHT